MRVPLWDAIPGCAPHGKPAAGARPPPSTAKACAACTAGEGRDYPKGIDYLTVWIGQHSATDPNCHSPPCFNPYWHGAMLQLARERGLNVAYYAYIIAFLAKATL